MKTIHFLIPAVLLSLSAFRVGAEDANVPVRIAIVGLNHDHAYGFIPRTQGRTDVQVVGIVESNLTLVARYSKRFHLNTNLFFHDFESLCARTNVQAVAIFTSTFEHRHVVEMCADHGIKTVMMEKPLAVNMEHARAIQAAAKRSGMKVIVNYETTWYPGNQEAYRMVWQDHAIGDLRKIVVHDGHSGPKEIGCSQEFLDWLTDPILDGGGALNDFGCYGADLITWLMHGERPTSVVAVTQQIKPDVYPKVEDEATIVLTYPKAQGIIQASWNWPFSRKDMEVYGKTGYVLVPKSDDLRVRTEHSEEKASSPAPLSPPNSDPLSYLAAVARGQIEPSGLSGLKYNMIVVEILDAAHQSARTGRRIDLTQ